MEIIDPTIYEGWDDLLLTHPQTTIFHTAAWASVLSESYHYTPLYFAAINGNKLSALIPVMEINSAITGKRGVSLPFTDQCEAIVSQKSDFTEICGELINYGKNAKWKSIEFRGPGKSMERNTPMTSFYLHSLNLKGNELDVLKQFRGSTVRNIKQAVKNGVQCSIKNSLESVADFYELNCLTRKNHGLPPQPWRFFLKLYEHIIAAGKGFVITAFVKGKSIAGAIYLHFNNKAIYKYAASNRMYQSLRPNNMVMWEAVRWYCRSGVQGLSLGRTDHGNKGLLQFKRGWGTKEQAIDYYRFDIDKNCFSPKNFNVKTSYTTLKYLPIPVLKFMGNILYRHVG